MSSTAPEKTGQALKEILAILNGFSGSISDDEVAAAKDFRIGRFTLATSSLHNIAAAWLSARLFHLGPDYVSRFTDRISAVSADEVRQTFSRSLEFSNPVVVIAGEEKKIRKSLAKHRFTSIRSMKIHY
jgi:zinc protease